MPCLASQCDYHLHSSASDGDLAPVALVNLAAERGLKEIALTDHDTFAGWDEAKQAADALDLRLWPAMEFSCCWRGATIHLVALWPQGLSAAALAVAEAQTQARWQRAGQIIKKLARVGVQLTLDEVVACAGGQVPGRPHFAQALVQAGYVKEHERAFRQWLGAGKLGDVKSHWCELDEAVKKLIASSAWVSLAHPLHYKMTHTKRRLLIQRFQEAGGQALEVVSGQQDVNQTRTLLQQAQALGLALTWGSDFHRPGWGCQGPGHYAALPPECRPLSELFEPQPELL